MSSPRPIAISCGEPAGIGPEIAAAAWRALGPSVPLIWIGDPAHLPSGTPWSEAVNPKPGTLAVDRIDMGAVPRTLGHPNPAHATGVIDAIERGVGLVQDGTARALCTAPIHKAALQDGAGFAYPGHTEFLAALGGEARSVMMLASDMLRVVPVTIHIPLSEVPQALTADLLAHTIRVTDAALRRDFGLVNPRIAVAGLNPHAGEDGKMGHEDQVLIAPVLDALRADGMQIEGPLSADTMFHATARARFDVAVAMYHDQALIPIKTLAFDTGVNVTLGLPFVRTSPDHGTALDIAGSGRANPSSMIEAIKLAALMADAREC